MKSPFTGKEMTLHHERARLIYRKEEYEYVKSYYLCEDTQTPLTMGDMDDANINQVYNQYRVKNGIPFADELRQMRESYGLSALKMSTILGFGDNQYRLYENGEMPSISNGRLLKSIMSPSTFRQFVETAKGQLSEKDYKSIMHLIDLKENTQYLDLYEYNLVFDGRKRCIDNGFAEMTIPRLRNIVLYFIEHCDNVFNTKMNKLLFYLDMVAYRESGFAMSGLAYKAIQFGPVPIRWDRVYSIIDGISQEIVNFDGGQGVKLIGTDIADLSSFTDKEKSFLSLVANKFRISSSVAISQMSHEEDAWKNAIANNGLIDFNDAFSLKAL